MLGLGRGWSLAIVIGGALGTLARLMLAEGIEPAGGFPWGTFAANVVGALLLGFLVRAVFWRRPGGAGLVPLLGTGFCGALTTFSALQVEALLLLERGAVAVGVSYVAASLAAGVLAVVAGGSLGARVAA